MMNSRHRLDLYTSLKSPVDFFRGTNFPKECLPQEVLIFFRGTPADGQIAQHHRFVLGFCCSASGSMLIDNDIIEIKPGEGCLIFPYQPHHFIQFNKEEIVWLFVSFELDDTTWLKPLKGHALTFTESAKQLLDSLVAAQISNTPKPLIAQLILLLEQLLNTPENKSESMGNSNLTQGMPQVHHLSKALAFIHDHLDMPLRVCDVSSASGCSETALQAVFENLLHSSIAAYIRRMRVLRACHLLDATTDPVNSISDQCGFSSQYAFSRTFKLVTGQSPRDFRKRLTQAPYPEA